MRKISVSISVALIRVMWFENDGGAALTMRWSPPTT